MKIRHLLPALLVSPWAAVPVVVVSGLGSSDSGLASDFASGLFFAILLALPAAYLGVACVGLPVYLLLRRLNCASPLLLCVIGAAAPFAVFFDPHRLREGLVAGACGIAVAAVTTMLLPKESHNAP